MAQCGASSWMTSVTFFSMRGALLFNMALKDTLMDQFLKGILREIVVEKM